MKPTTEGNIFMNPVGADISMAGIKSDHIDAATITPAAKPNNALFIEGLIFPL